MHREALRGTKQSPLLGKRQEAKGKSQEKKQERKREK
jgi:hypothetical protein